MDLKEEMALVLKARTDGEAFSTIYDLNYPKIFNYILKRTANLEVAQDITSEVFLKAFTKIWQFKFRQIPFSAWLYRIASNEICNYMKKNSYKTVSLEEMLEERGFEPTIDASSDSEMKEAEAIQELNRNFYDVQVQILKLPLKFQTVITLKFFEKKTMKEIGEIIGKKEGTVKSRLSRGMEKLRALMKENDLKGNFQEKKEL